MRDGKRRTFRLETDCLPERLFEHSVDWSGLAITRLLASPLFKEGPERTIRPSVCEKCERESPLVWLLTLSPGARWSNGARITADEVSDQLLRVRKAGGGDLPLILHVSSIEPISEFALRVTTRYPLAHLDRLLCSPAFAPRDVADEIYSGSYRLAARHRRTLHLESLDGSHDLEIVQHETGRTDLFRCGRADFSGPMTISPEEWTLSSREKESSCFDLDILYALEIPDWVPLELRDFIRTHIEREAICAAAGGFVTPCASFTGMWKPTPPPEAGTENAVPAAALQGRHSITYTDFTGNREVAQALCEEMKRLTGAQFVPALTDFGELLAPERNVDAFGLILSSSAWPHPASFLTPFVFSRLATEPFIEKYKEAINSEDLDEAATLARTAEAVLGHDRIGIMPLGRVTGCIRSHCRNSIWCPNSGWIDYRAFIEELM